jgi:hypothetical protein
MTGSAGLMHFAAALFQRHGEQLNALQINGVAQKVSMLASHLTSPQPLS